MSWHFSGRMGWVVLIAVSIGAGVEARAEAVSLTLDAAVHRAMTKNADLAAARWMVDEARGRARQAGRWENPELEGELAPNARGRERRLSLGFSQRFPVTARLRAERVVARTRVAAAESEVRDVERRLAAEVREAGVRLLILEARDGLRSRQQANGRELVDALRRAAAAGEGQSLEADQMELELARLETARLQAGIERADALGRFLLLVGLSPETEVRWQESLSEPGTAGLPELALDSQPAYRAANFRAAAAAEAIDVARTQRWQDLRAGVFGEWERAEDAPRGVESETFVGVRLSMPLPLWNRGRGRVEEAAATAARAERETFALEQHLRSEAATALHQMAAAERFSQTLDTELLPRARQLEERLAQAHREGLRPLSDLLRARERRLELDASRVDALADYHLARCRYLAVAGPLPPAPSSPSEP